MERAGLIVGVLATGGLAGAMVFFGAVIAPLVFSRLPSETAGPFIRAVFPRYYLFMLAGATLAALGFAAVSTLGVVAMGAVALVTVWLRWVLMPQINRLRDRDLAGDVAAGRAFAHAHRLSVVVNQVQLLMALAVLVWVLLGA